MWGWNKQRGTRLVSLSFMQQSCQMWNSLNWWILALFFKRRMERDNLLCFWSIFWYIHVYVYKYVYIKDSLRRENLIQPQLCSYVYVVTRSTEILMTGWSTGQSSYRPTRKMCLIKSMLFNLWWQYRDPNQGQSIRKVTLIATQQIFFIWGLVISVAGLRNESKFSDLKVTQKNT